MKIVAIGSGLADVVKELRSNDIEAELYSTIEGSRHVLEPSTLQMVEAHNDIATQLEQMGRAQEVSGLYNKVVLVSLGKIATIADIHVPPFVLDIVQYPGKGGNFPEIMKALVKMTSTRHAKNGPVREYKIPASKRIFDIAVSSTLLLILAPILLAIAFFIKVGSKGHIIYKSPRVGTGYRIFPFYKFRSMRPDADKLLENLKHLNHYADSTPATANPARTLSVGDEAMALSASEVLIGDNFWVEEPAYHAFKQNEDKNSFVKITNDPRITKIGKVIRNTSMDELPQLFNVLFGHMSIVGNRPLPLYEAEKLTSDDWSKRFMAPAGITGLWQVTERGKKSTSQDSRKRLDIEYAENYSLWMDVKILMKTPLAALQHENV